MPIINLLTKELKQYDEEKFKVVDLYEGFDVVGYANTLKEVKQLAKQQYNDCDGECAICYYPLNDETQKYNRSKIKFLETF